MVVYGSCSDNISKYVDALRRSQRYEEAHVVGPKVVDRDNIDIFSVGFAPKFLAQSLGHYLHVGVT
jgi:hypothetical protein